MESLLPSALPVPAVLAGGAGAVLGTAAVLSGWAAQHPQLKSQRWSRSLPKSLRVAVDAPATRVALRGAGALTTAVGLAALARRTTPTAGLTVLPGLVALALLTGPSWRLLNPTRIGVRLQPVASRPDADVWPATAWLATLGLVALSTTSAAVLAGIAALYLVVVAVASWRWGLRWHRRHDASEALIDLISSLAPVFRAPDGTLAWRNPLVAATHATLPPGALALCAVVIGLSAAQGLEPTQLAARLQLPVPAIAALSLIACTVVAGALLRLTIIRPFFRSSVVPVAAAYGLLAADRWWMPVDLLVFVGLHLVAVVILHRQALARHDLRTARAVQFPPRLLLIGSVTCGLALWAGG